MKTNPLPEQSPDDSLKNVAPITRSQVQTRARELALIAGRTSLEISLSDYKQAKRELTGETELDRQDAVLDALPETKRWDPVPGSSGQQAPENPSDDEDDEGRSETEQMVDEGAEEAQRQQILQAAVAAEEKARRGN